MYNYYGISVAGPGNIIAVTGRNNKPFLVDMAEDDTGTQDVQAPLWIADMLVQQGVTDPEEINTAGWFTFHPNIGLGEWRAKYHSQFLRADEK